MIAEKIKSVRMALGVLAGQVSENQWEMIKMAQAELSDAADTVEELEARLECPRELSVPIVARPRLHVLVIANGPMPETPAKEAVNGQA